MRMNGLLSPSSFFRVIVLGFLLTNVGCSSTNGWVMNRSGMRQYQRGHYAQARHRFSRAIAHDPCNPDYRHNLAMAIQKQGDMVVCEKILRYNLTINAMHQPTYHSLAQLLITEGRAPEAQDLVAGWVATQPYVPESNVEMAWIQRETGDYAGAEQSLQSALKADPTHAIALAHLGQLYQTSGRPDQAATYYQRSLASHWDQPEVQSRLSTLTDPSSSSRSAMMRNPPSGPTLASNSMMIDQPMFEQPMIVSNPMMTSDSMIAGRPSMMTSTAMVTGVPFASDPQAIALEDVNLNPPPKKRHRKHGKENEAIMTAYPLPAFDAPQTAWAPAGTFSGQPALGFQPPGFAADPNGMPQMADNGYAPNPTGQQLIPQADPAHFSPPEMTASLPVVEPH